MKIAKFITTTEDIEIEIEIEEITLLSAEEAKEVDESARAIANSWWLRSPGSFGDHAARVLVDGFVTAYGGTVHSLCGVRPALRVSNIESFNLQIGDAVAIAGYRWEVISPQLILCDKIVGRSAFREDFHAPDANDYEKSDIKKWLAGWAKDNGIAVKGKRR